MSVSDKLLSSKSHKKIVDNLFSQWNKIDSPGCALGVIHHGQLIYARGYGMANLDHDIHISSQSVFRIASTSKQFTAMCIALLAESGRIKLDDEIDKYIPGMSSYGHPIQIQHLLHHTSGMRDYVELMELAGMRDEDYYSNEEALDIILKQKSLNFKPGETYLYSNTGYFLLGEIVKHASGQSLREFAKKNIFDPLGMANTHFHDDHAQIVKGLATGYSPDDQGGYRIDMTTLDMVGDGGVHTSIEDLLLWDQNFYHNTLGNGNETLIQMMLTPGRLNNGEIINYALGLSLWEYQGQKIISHSGGFVGYRAEMMRFPDHELSVICLANLSSIEPTYLTKKVAEVCLTELQVKRPPETSRLTSIPVEIPPSDLNQNSGLYWNSETGIILTLEFENNVLTLCSGDYVFQLYPTSETHWCTNNSPIDIYIEFINCTPETSLQVKLQVEDENPQLLHKIQVFDPPVTDLKDFVGKYYSQELNTIYEISLDENRLFLIHKNAPKEVLRPGSRDMFWVGELILMFERDSVKNRTQGSVTGFSLSAGRVNNILFEKN